MKTTNKPMTTKQAYKKIYSASRGGGLLELLLVVDEVEKKSDHFTSRKIVGCIDRMRNENRPLIEFDLEMRLRCYKHQKSKENQNKQWLQSPCS
ncbi:hypothetical protein [Aliivibrio finisterrensis]|uniref:hypothetical protein n=1 Tax=Aliivibrio finisterrensis TaxID=511998 RepID=UPI001021FD59|nr:hypothetical protein [Aliivibrio finisterrensis]RYU50018.1 hypothetical protein ERW56_15695 [Aliivibrio finisterrensis]RYU55719.1 hypothetical protein ERW50_15750 [Aliivibrio finisterrensis]RYU80910.1 hypothetical protein ERW55_15565 [Aliivibrio finisterrensis]